jgi:phosphate transport system substrate-binding protein
MLKGELREFESHEREAVRQYARASDLLAGDPGQLPARWVDIVHRQQRGVIERAGATAERFAVVVHPSTSASDVSLEQLRRIFLGEQQYWAGGTKVVLLIYAPGTKGREVVLRRLYQMDESAFRRYWITKTFRADLTTGPKIVSSSALAKKLTATIPGAIAVIPASEVDESVKVLNVDRRSPEDGEYPLVWSAP